MTDNELNENDDLNIQIEEEVDVATVITVPIDDTLSNSGEAADAKAVGDALALKADRSELQNAISVDGQTADNQGLILLYGEHINMSSTDSTKVSAAIEAAAARTGADIPLDSSTGAPTVKAAIEAAQSDLLPVGTIYMSTSSTAPAFTGTWVEIRITASWSDLKNGNRNYTDGAGSGTVHFWLRTA